MWMSKFSQKKKIYIHCYFDQDMGIKQLVQTAFSNFLGHLKGKYLLKLFILYEHVLY